MMSPCKKCLERMWDFEHNKETGFITAICQNCGYEVQFPDRKTKRELLKLPNQ